MTSPRMLSPPWRRGTLLPRQAAQKHHSPWTRQETAAATWPGAPPAPDMRANPEAKRGSKVRRAGREAQTGASGCTMPGQADWWWKAGSRAALLTPQEHRGLP